MKPPRGLGLPVSYGWEVRGVLGSQEMKMRMKWRVTEEEKAEEGERDRQRKKKRARQDRKLDAETNVEPKGRLA